MGILEQLEKPLPKITDRFGLRNLFRMTPFEIDDLWAETIHIQRDNRRQRAEKEMNENLYILSLFNSL